LEEKKRREEAEYEKRVAEQVEMMEEDDEEREAREIEERRRRRAEIAAKHAAQLLQNPPPPKVEPVATVARTGDGSAPAAEPHAEPSASGRALAAPTGDDETGAQGESESEDGAGPAVARATSVEDQAKATELRAFMNSHRRQSEIGKGLAPAAKAAAVAAAAAAAAAQAAGEGGGEDAVDEFDMFNDEVEFVANPEAMLDEAAAMDRGDNYDDKEGYFAHRVGDLLSDRYKVKPPPQRLSIYV